MSNLRLHSANRFRNWLWFLLTLVSGGNLAAQSSQADWASYNRTYDSQRFSPLDQINTGNVAKLRLTSTFDTGDTTSFSTGPLAINGVLYFTTEFNTFAIDGVTGKQVWKCNYPYSPGTFLKSNRGAAYLNGYLFRGAGNGHVYAINAKTGKLAWDVKIADPKKGETVPAAPIAWKGKVFIGNAGGDQYGVLGRVYALNAATGKTEWTFYVVPDKTKGTTNVEASWENDKDIPRAGGATWTSYTLDTTQNTLWIPGGNPAPDFVKGLRKGDNLYTNSVVAVNASTGKYIVHYQLVKEDFHDWDVSAAPVLLRTQGGHDVVATAIKDGHLYGVDRSSGKFLYKTPVTRIENADAPITEAGTRFCPGAQGGVEWNGPAFYPALNMLYVNATDWCTTAKLQPMSVTKGQTYGQAWTGAPKEQMVGKQDEPSEWAGWLTAIDADNGKVMWKYKSPAPMLGGVTATAGGLVFAGEIVNNVLAFDAKTGDKLWSYPTDGAVGGGIITYSVNGKEYIAAAVGLTSPIWPTKKITSRIMIFSLPE